MPIIEPKNNSTVIIRTNDEKKLTVKTAILNYDKAKHLITINGKYFEPEETPRVSLLILEDNNIIECQGVVRKQDSFGRRDISIFNIRSKESRSAVRYNINTKATIENIIIAGKVVPLGHAIEVSVENISTDGVLICTEHPSFNVDSSFQLRINIAGNDVLINTCIVRTFVDTDGERKFGCRFISISE